MPTSHDCFNCRYYPCYETEKVHDFVGDMDVKITLNGCYKFIGIVKGD